MPDHEPIEAAAQQYSQTEREEPSRGNSLDSESRDHLLSIVLRETLSRTRDDPTELLRALRQWRGGIGTDEFDQLRCAEMVDQVLRYRLGTEAEMIPGQMCQELGEVLWNDPVSQSRLKRLWIALRITP